VAVVKKASSKARLPGFTAQATASVPHHLHEGGAGEDPARQAFTLPAGSTAFRGPGRRAHIR